jgi:hypothetical protein
VRLLRVQVCICLLVFDELLNERHHSCHIVENLDQFWVDLLDGECIIISLLFDNCDLEKDQKNGNVGGDLLSPRAAGTQKWPQKFKTFKTY